MKRKNIVNIMALVLVMSSVPSMAADYTVTSSSSFVFGEATSVPAIIDGGSVPESEIDKSKNSALIPPKFGSNTSNLRGTGVPLTPNLASPYTDTVDSVIVVDPPASAFENPLPMQSGSFVQGDIYIPGVIGSGNGYYYESELFTPVTEDMYYSAGYLGTLKIPAIGVTAKVYEGTTSAVLNKGAGHFVDSSIWNGNVCIAAHNRGTNAYFGEIHTLEYDDTIEFTTKRGTRTYRVYNVEKISVNDTSNLQATGDNIITLITCVKNQADYYRWCVQAIAVN